MCFELGKNVGIAVVDNGLGEAGDYRMKSAVHGRILRCIHTAQMQRQKLLESHCDDVRCSGRAREKGRDLQGRRQPVDKVLRQP